jgi:cytochrome c biogenesis factor
VRPSEEGKASGANSAIREVGGALGVAVLASVFTSQGSTLTGEAFVDGLVPAVWVGAAALAAGALLALAVPGRRPRRADAESIEQPPAEAPALPALAREISAS